MKFVIFLKNIWIFRKFLWYYRWWDFVFILQSLKYSIKNSEKNLRKKGNEIELSRFKKCDKMKRAVDIIDHIINYNYIELAEKELNKNIINKGFYFLPIENSDSYEMLNNLDDYENNHNNEIYKKSDEIEEKEWNELINILKGQDYSKFDKNKDWDEQFDGSGLRNWWD